MMLTPKYFTRPGQGRTGPGAGDGEHNAIDPLADKLPRSDKRQLKSDDHVRYAIVLAFVTLLGHVRRTTE